MRWPFAALAEPVSTRIAALEPALAESESELHRQLPVPSHEAGPTDPMTVIDK
jgi:hypothetical protein